jgi:dihydrofolate reductase
MRDVIAGLFMSVDGVVEAPDQWQFDSFDDETGVAMSDFLARVDTILLGRVTYEQWATYWPTSQDEPFATFINNTPKYVVSTTLDRVEWGAYDRVALIKGNLAEALSQLKQQPGRSISTAGSPTLVRSLLEQGLLDELTLTIHPVVAGRGQRLFRDGGDLKRLRLVASQTTSMGNVLVSYQPRNEQ